ncbi:MAG TPA: hypothetical protein VFZ48_01870 [Candidatus Saccharimonadales bacterium]
MRYHYQKGASFDTEGKGRGKIVFFGFVLLIAGGYVGFLMILPSIGGGPLVQHDAVATKIRSVAPGGDGNYLYIPKINVQVMNGTANADFKGEPNKTLEVTASAFTLATTPTQTLAASPFARLDQLTKGDEIFVDNNGTRYAYKVTDQADKATLLLYTPDKSKGVKAERVGTIAWNDGDPKLQAN